MFRQDLLELTAPARAEASSLDDLEDLPGDVALEAAKDLGLRQAFAGAASSILARPLRLIIDHGKWPGRGYSIPVLERGRHYSVPLSACGQASVLHGDVLGRRQAREEMVILKDETDGVQSNVSQFIVTQLLDVGAVHDHLAPVGAQDAGDHTQQRGLTTA